MKNIFKLLMLAIVGCGFTSCKDFLYPEPTDTLVDANYYKTDAQIETSLTSIYATLRSNQLGTSYLKDLNSFTDESYFYNSSDDRPSDYSATSSNGTVQGLWTALYAPLKDISYLLDGLERNSNLLSPDVYRHAKGEALFLRGYFHFLLAQWFCHPDVGIPMYLDKITTYEGTMMKLSSLDDFYVQIVKDMESAEILLEDQTWSSLGYSERVTVDAVRGILARVCLYAAGFPNNGSYKGELKPEFYYKKALSKALSVIDMGHDLAENYSDVFIAEVEDRYLSENIWEVGYNYGGTTSSDTNTGGGIGSQNHMGMIRKCTDPETGDDIYDSCLVNSLYHMPNPLLYIAYGAGDTRREWNYPNFTYETNTLKKIPKTLLASTCSPVAMGVTNYEMGTLPSAQIWGAHAGKWRREYEERIARDLSSTTTNFPLLRYSDVLLMAAEAHIELGEPAKAAPYINQVRSRSIPYNTPTKIISRIIVEDAGYHHRGWAHTPVVNVIEPGSGTGFEFMVETSLVDNNQYGMLSIGITNPGSGYETVPTLQAEPPHQTWEAGSSYNTGDFVSVITGTSVKIYRALTAGISTTVPPTHTTTLDDEPNLDPESTVPSYSDAKKEQGLAWFYETTSSTAVPDFTIETIDSEVADVAYYVDIADQEAMREFLRAERMRELCFEGLRRQDLRRWGTLIETIKKYDILTSGTIDGIPASTGQAHFMNIAGYIEDYKLFLPIPLTQLSLNRNLVQNPGY